MKITILAAFCLAASIESTKDSNVLALEGIDNDKLNHLVEHTVGSSKRKRSAKNEKTVEENWSKTPGHINSVFYLSLIIYVLIFIALYFVVSYSFSICLGESDFSWYLKLVLMSLALVTYFRSFIQPVFDKRNYEFGILEDLQN